jgi:hypothetical protein
LYYIYNEVALLALSEVAQVANAVKLVVIILFCSLCLMQPRGSAMVYSIGLRSYRDTPV